MPTGGVYLFLGPDRPRKLQRIHELERTLGIQPLDRHQVDAATTTSAQLLALSRQQPAASPVRFIVVDQAHRLDNACVDALRQQAPVIAKSACLVLLVELELSLRHALAQPSEAITTERFPGRSTPPVKPFALTDALGTGDVARALAAVHDQLLAGKEPLELLGLVAWQLHRWVMIRRLLNAGYSAERMAVVTGLRSWQVQRLHSEVAHRSLGSLQQVLEQCWQLDVDAKSGRIIPELAIEQLVVEACVTNA
jgi:DNA polymerase III delta subunit